MKLHPLGAFLALTCLSAGAGAFHLHTRVEAPRADHEAELKALRKEYKEGMRAFRDALRAATTAAEQTAALNMDPWAPVAERFQVLAEAAEGTEVAAGCLAMIYEGELRYGEKHVAMDAFGVLAFDHPNTEELESVLQRVQYETPTDLLLEGLHHILENSERDSLKAGSLFSLAKMLESDEATREEAFGYYERIIAEFPGVDAGRGQTYDQRAEGALFEARHLQTGMIVPDMEAVDETGSAFKLSDYRGKVVLVDFWGFW